jgi:RHS repeat-associated protein
MNPDYQYTGQRTVAEIGLHFYNARWYDSYLNHFTQPDSIVPDPYNPQDWNRYSYVRYNPMRYTDPTGHVCVEGGGTDNEVIKSGNCGGYSSQGEYKGALITTLKEKYKWNVKGDDWTLQELQTIYRTGRDIENYVDGLTGGKGLTWMKKYLGGVSIFHGGDGGRSYAWPWRHIYLGKGWVRDYKGGDFWSPNQLLAHEFGHIWDMSSGNYLGIGGGVGDDLMWAVWGDPTKSLRVFRYEKTGDPAIPHGDARWRKSVNGGYGNGSVNDYAAEAFSWSIYNSNYLPFGSNGVVAMVVDQTIIQQANATP